MHSRFFFLGLVLGSAACATTSTPGNDAASDTSTDAAPTEDTVAVDTPSPPNDAPLADAGATHQFTVNMPDVPLTPGTETTQCVELRLGNTTAQLIRHIHVSLAPGSHHLIFYRSNSTTESRTPTPCEPLGGVTLGTAPLFIAQATESDLQVPDGVGLTLVANQIVRVEEHFLDVTSASLVGTGTVTVDTVDPGPSFQAADLMFWGTTNIDLAPHTMGSAEMFRTVRAGTHIFGLTAHEHHLGTLTTIAQATSQSDPGTELYRNTNWAEPPLTQFAPPLAFDGSTGLRLHCDYNNTTDNTVTFGESAQTNEMCFFWAYYYPSHGFDAHF